MRAVRRLFCAVVLTAFLAPAAGADEYTKQTFLTFSGPVQLPGLTLPAGTYQFKLADPASGRRTLQVWDKDGATLFATLLTIPDQRMTPTNEPVVMFNETASGDAQPIRAWFYPNETYGMEFVYPKDQATRIARATGQPVLSFDDDEKKDEDGYRAAHVGRVDASGTMADADRPSDVTPSSTASAQPGATTTAGAATTTADRTSQAADTAGAAGRTTSQNAQAERNTAERNADAMPSASASRANSTDVTRAQAPAAPATRSEANRDNIPNQAVGTSGSSAQSANTRQPAQAGAGARELPRTAGSSALIPVFGLLSLAGAFVIRSLRPRSGASR